MNEYEIRRALAGAGTPSPTPDPDRLRAALVHADRLRTVRMAMALGAVTIVATLGLFALQTGETTAPVDVVDTPDAPTPEAGLPVLEGASTETTTTTAPASTTTWTPPTTTGVPDTAPPAAAPDQLTAPTTAPAPAQIAATTTSTTTTSAAPPPTTTTSAAPTTTTSTTTTTTTTISFGADFTASARYGSCEEDPPYDEYSGTAAADATITVMSAYSPTTATTADEFGNWFIRVEFPTAPANVHFDVTVTDGTEHAVFDFVHTV
ncbi:MAG: hypothetical protein AAF548_02555 [Actinomycetota bacterium]